MQFYDLIKSRVECHDFREKIELAQVSVPQDLAGKMFQLCLFTQFDCQCMCNLVVEITNYISC